jgi:hypothetical protein
MTISSETTKSGPYDGNGSTDTFAYAFLVYDEADLEVVLKSSAGVETIKSISTHYTVTGVGASSGNVVMGTPPASGETLTIRRKQALTQGTDLTNQGAYVGETHERVFDETIQKVQQVDEEVERSIKVGVSQATAGIDFTLPGPTASTVIGAWNAAADAIEAGPTVSAINNAQTNATAAAASAVTAAAEASAANPKYTFSTTTSMADPGAGTLRYNHATVASVSAIAIDDTTADTGNPDIEAWIASWDDSTSTIKGWLRLVEPGTPANYAVFHITALTNNSGWVQLAVTHVDSNGTFGNGDSIRVMFSRTGDKGDTGSTGAQGPAGAGVDTLTTRGDLLAQGASAAGRLAIGSANTVLTTAGTDPAWTTVTNAMLAGSIDLTSKVTGVLPLANGGTGAANLAAANIVATNAINTFTKAQVPSTYTAALSATSGVLDYDTYTNFIITLAAGSNTLAAPTTEASQIGQCGVIIFIQPSSGSAATLSLHGDYETAAAAGITLSTANNDYDIVPYIIKADNSVLLGAAQLNFG